MSSKALLTVTEAAKVLKVSPDTLRNWEKAGKLIPERTPGGARRYQLSILQELLKEKTPAKNPVVLRRGMISITKAASIVGVSADTLRNWEKKGLISADRTDGGARRYSKAQLTALKREMSLDDKNPKPIRKQPLNTAQVQALIDQNLRLVSSQNLPANTPIPVLTTPEPIAQPQEPVNSTPIANTDAQPLNPTIPAAPVPVQPSQPTQTQMPAPVITQNAPPSAPEQGSTVPVTPPVQSPPPAPLAPLLPLNVNPDKQKPIVAEELANTIRQEIERQNRPTTYGYFRKALPTLIIITFLLPIMAFGISKQSGIAMPESEMNKKIFDLASTVEQIQQGMVKQSGIFSRTTDPNAQKFANHPETAEINAGNTTISGELTVNGSAVFLNNVSAPNLLSTLTAGDNIIISGDDKNPVISAVGGLSKEADTLNSVTARGPTTDKLVSFNAGANFGTQITLGNLDTDPDSSRNGSMYYNTNSNKYRCYTDGSWKDCDTDTNSGGSSFSGINLAGDLGTSQILNDGNTLAIKGSNGLQTTTSDTDLLTISLNLPTSGTSTTTASNSGLEVGPEGLSMLRGCTNGELLKWNASASQWQCASDSGSSSGSTTIQENDVDVLTSATTIDFNGSDFDITESPIGEANIAIDYTNSGITRKNQAETIAASWTFNNPVTFNGTTTFQANDITDAEVSDTLTVGAGGSVAAVAVTGSLTDSQISNTLTIDATGSVAAAAVTGTFVDSQVSNTLTIDATGSVDVGAITGTITDAQISDTLTASIFKGTGSTTNAVDLGSAEVNGTLPDANVADNITISSAGTVDWTALNNYPTACGVNQAVSGIGDTLTCVSLSGSEVDGVIGNEVTDATNTTLTRSGSGTDVSPYTLGLNLTNANTWAALQTFSNGGSFTQPGNTANDYALFLKRNTDTAPAGYFIRARNAAQNTDIFAVNTAGSLIAGSTGSGFTINFGTSTVSGNITGTNIDESSLAGLTTANFTSANISQWTNNSGYITTSSSDTLTNKTISAASNTISNLTNANLSGTAGITNANLANSAVTVTAGAGLINGGSVSLGSSTTLNIGAGNGVTVNADDIAINLTTAGTTGSTASNSGMEVGSGGLTLLKGCADNQLLKYTDAGGWACANDNSSGSLTVRESDTSPTVTPATTVEFGPGTSSTDEFILTNQGGGVARINLGTKVANLDSLQTFTNKSIDASTNTITNLSNASLTNDTIDFDKIASALTLDEATTISASSSLNLNIGNNVTLTTSGSGSIIATNLVAGSSVVSDAEVDDTITISAGGSVAAAAITGSLTDAQISNTLTLDATSSVDWTSLNNYPAACGVGEAVSAIGDTLTCVSLATSIEVDGVIGNEVTDATDATLTRSGSGTDLSPYTLGLNLTNANTWSAQQTFNQGTSTTKTIVADSGTTTNIANFTVTTPADSTGTQTHNLLNLAPTVGNATGGSNTLNLINIADLIGDDEVNISALNIGNITASAGTEIAIKIGSGWDQIFDLNGTLISGTELTRLDGKDADLVDINDAVATAITGTGTLTAGTTGAGFTIDFGSSSVSGDLTGSNIDESSLAGLTTSNFATNDISQWNNNSGYITAASSDTLTNKIISTATNNISGLSPSNFTSGGISQWTNDSGYITASTLDTLTNKTIDTASNTITGLTDANLSGSAGISNANLANPTINLAADSGSGSVDLGGTVTINGGGATNVSVSGSTYTISSTEADTLASVTGRGNSTTTGINLTQNGNTPTDYALYLKRNDDTTPVGYLIQAQNNAGDSDLFAVDVNGVVTTGTWNGTALTDAYVSDTLTIGAGGSIAAAAITGTISDAQVSDTLTASNFIGSGSTTNAVDLGTAEVAGTLGDSNISDSITVGAGGSVAAAAVTGSISDAQVSDTLTASIFKGSGSTTDAIDLETAEVAGTLSDANVSNSITIDNTGSVDWAALNNFPSSCGAGQAVTAVGTTLTCASFLISESGDAVIGNEVTDTTDGSLTRSGSGTNLDPYTLALNTANANTWNALQTFENGGAFTQPANTASDYAIYLKRNTDTASTGYLIQAQNAAANADLFAVNSAGILTAGATGAGFTLDFGSSTLSGNITGSNIDESSLAGLTTTNFVTDDISQWNNNSGYITASSSDTLTNKVISTATNNISGLSASNFTSGNISQWTNNSGYITASSTDTLTNKTIDTATNTISNLTTTNFTSANISQWTNDAGYLAAVDISSNTNLSASNGITLTGDALSLDTSYSPTWTGTHTFTKTVTNDGSIQNINLTLGNDADTDTVSALNIAVTSANTGDADTVYGLNIGDLASADATVQERAIRIGANWDQVFDLNGTLISAAELGRLDGKDAALVDLNDAVATAITGTGTLTAGATGAGFTLDFGTSTLSGNITGSNIDESSLAGLTTANFTSANISQWTNNAGYITDSSTDTLTNKTIAAASNTISGLTTAHFTSANISQWTNNSGYITASSSDTLTNKTFDANGVGNSISNIDNTDLLNDTIDLDKVASSLTLDEQTDIAAGSALSLRIGNNVMLTTTGTGAIIATNLVASGSVVADSEVDDNITISSSGTVDWTALSNYPAACGAGQAITALGDSPTCSAFLTSENGDAVIGNEVTDTADTTLTRSGSGTGGSPYKLALNLANANTWTGLQTFNNGTTASKTISADSGTTNTISQISLSTPADTTGTQTHNGLSVTGTIGNASGGTNTANLINIANVTGDDEVTLNAIKIGNLTSSAGTETAINIGSGWDYAINANGTTITLTELGRLNGKNAALVDTNDAVATAITGTGTLTSGSTSTGFTLDFGNSTLSGNVTGSNIDESTLAGLTTSNFTSANISQWTNNSGYITASSTDTLTNKSIAAGSNTITGLTNANLSGTAGISNANLANSSVTVTAGAGLTNGGSVSLGGSTTLDIGAGNGITVNANDIAINLTGSGTSGSTSSNSGLEVGSGGLTLLKGCADSEILKYTDAGGWACSSDSTGTSSLDTAYNNGQSITVDAANVLFNLSDATNDYNFTIDNATNGTIDTAMAITTTGGVSSVITTAIDLSDADIVTALALGSNDVTVGGATISSTEFSRLDNKDAALVDTNDAVATAITGTGTLTAGATGAGFTLNFGTSTLSGSIGDTNIADNITISSSGSVDVGALSGTISDGQVSDTLTASIFKGSGSTTNAVDLATAEVSGTLGDGNISDALTIDNTGSVDWTALNNYPAGCGAGQAVTALGDTPTCTAFLTSESGDAVIGNEVTDAADATLTRSGSGTGGSPYKLALNLSNANTWTALQTLNAGIDTTKTIAANTGTTNNVAKITLTTPADSSGTNVHQGLNIVGTIGNATNGTNTTNLINIENLSGDDQVTLNAIKIGNVTASSGTETAINIGSGWDYAINANGTTISLTELGRLNGKDAALVDTNDTVTTAITGTGTLTSGATGAGFTINFGASTLSGSVGDSNIADDITISSSGSVDWTALNNYPSACSAGNAITALGDSPTCGAFLTAEVDAVIGNEVTNATDTTLTRSGSGNGGSPYTLGLNLNNGNTWTALQTFNAGISTTKTIAANTGTTNNINTLTLTTPADSSGTQTHNGLNLAFTTGASSGGTNIANGINIASTIGDATAGTNTANLINIAALTNDAQVTLNAINIGTLTPTGATETAIKIGAGWDNIFDDNGTLISAGELNLLDGGVTLGELTDSGTFTVSTGGFSVAPSSTGTLNNVTIGNSTAAAGTFTALTSTGTTAIGNGTGAVTIDSTGTITLNDATISLANQATSFAIKDNTAAAFAIAEGANTYFSISTTDAAPVVALNTLENGGTFNIGSTNFSRTINIGTGSAADTIHIGEGGTNANTITIGSDAVANTITIGSSSATTVSITDDNWSIGAGGAAVFASVSEGGTALSSKYAPINANFITVTSNGTLTGETGIDALTTAISTTNTLNVDSASTLNAVTIDANANFAMTDGTGTFVQTYSPLGTTVTANGLTITPKFTLNAADQTLSALYINPNTNSNNDTGDTLYGINIDNITNSSATEIALRIGTGWEKGISIGALSTTIQTGIDIGNLTGTSLNVGLNIGTLSGVGAISNGINVGDISSTGTINYGIKLGNLTGGTVLNSQYAAGTVTAVASALNAGLVLGAGGNAITGTAAASNNYGIIINPIDAVGNSNFGVYISAVSGSATNYSLYAVGGQSYFANNVGIGDDTTPDVTFEIEDNVAEQFRLGYDNTHYTSFSTSAAGNLTVTPTGGTITLGGTLDANSNIITNIGSTATYFTTSGSLAIGLDAADANGVLMVDNVAQSSPIFVAKDNGTMVFQIADNGLLTIDPATTGTVANFALATQWTTGTMINGAFGSSTTQTGALTGMSLAFGTNLTALTSSSSSLTGYTMTSPSITNSSNSTYTFTGFGISSAGALTSNTTSGATINWTGANFTLPTVTTSTAGTVGTVNGLTLTIPTTPVTQTAGTASMNGINIPTIATGPASGTLNGISIGNITTAGAGTEVALNIGQGWDTAIQVKPSAAFTQSSALTGLTLDYNSSYTAASAQNITGINMLTPSVTAAGATTYTGLNLTTVGALTSNGGNATFNGINITTPNITQTANTAAATGINLTLGTLTTGGTQTGIKITGSNSNGAGTQVGIDLPTALTAGAATEYAMRIAKGWDASIAFGALTANDNTTQGVIRFATSGNTGTTCAISTAQGLIFQDQAGNQIGHFCKDSSTGMEIAANSTLLNGTDVAENYSDYANELEPGDLVITETNGPRKTVKKATNAYDGHLFGVVSTEPGVLLSDIEEGSGQTELINPKAIALTGRIPTKVSTENGPIKIGDYLTSSSTPGVAMKATQAGMVIGTALEDFNGNGVGKIYSFARTSYLNQDQTIAMGYGSSGTNNIADLANTVQLLNTTVETLKDEIHHQDQQIASINATLALDNQGFMKIPNLKTDKLIISTDLTAVNTITAKDFALDSSKLNAVGTLAALPVSETQTVSLADALNALNDAQQIADNRIKNLEVSDASQSAELADAKNLSQEAVSHANSLDDKVNETTSNLDSLKAKIDDLLAGLSGGSSNAAPSSTPAPSITPASDLTATDSATLASNFSSDPISVKNITVSETLKSLGETLLGKTTLAGDFTQDGTFSISNGNEINVIGTGTVGANDGVLYLQKNPLALGIDIFDGKVLIDNTGGIRAESVTVADFKVVKGKISGSGTIKAGDKSVIIDNTLTTTNSRILITVTSQDGAILAVTNKKDHTSFTVTTAVASNKDITFDWWMIQEVAEAESGQVP